MYLNIHGSIALFPGAKREKQPKCPSMDEWVHKMWSVHTMECYSAIERNEVLKHVITEMNLKKQSVKESGHKSPYIIVFV